MSVLIDGPTVAALFCSHSNSFGNQEGFLFGQISNHVKDDISDSQTNQSQVQTYIHVSSYLPWPKDDQVYTRRGIPIPKKMAALAGERIETVVGWYSFRRNSCLRMSMKEQTLHRMLATTLLPSPQEDFIFFLCTTTANMNFSTHSMDHFFVKGLSGKLTKVSVKILNLGDTVHSEYKTHVNATVMQSASLKSILTHFRPHFESESKQKMLEMIRMDEMSCALHTSLRTICDKVAESERMTATAEEEVWYLQEELRQKEAKNFAAKTRPSVESLGAGEGEPSPVISLHQVWSNPTHFKDTMGLSGKANSVSVQVRPVVDMHELATTDIGSCKKEQHNSKGGLSIDDMLSVNTQAPESADSIKDCLQPVNSKANDVRGWPLNSVSIPLKHIYADGKAVKEKVEQTNDAGRKRMKIEQKKIDKPAIVSCSAEEAADHLENIINTGSKYGRCVEDKSADAAKSQSVALISGPQTERSQAREEAIQGTMRLKQNMQMTNPVSCSTSTSASASSSGVPPDPCSSLSVLNKDKNVDVLEVCVPVSGGMEERETDAVQYEQRPAASSASCDKDSKSGSIFLTSSA